MIIKMYSVLDKAVGAFLNPFFARTDAEATRSFSDAANDPKHPFATHADDYVLYCVGEWNDADASIYGLETPNKIVSGLAVSALHVQSSRGTNGQSPEDRPF